MNFMMKLQLLLNRIKYINLCKTWSFVKRKKKIIHRMIKNILYSKSINFCYIYNIDDNSIEFDVKRNERYYIIIWLNILLKIFNSFDSNDFIIDIDMSFNEKNLKEYHNLNIILFNYKIAIIYSLFFFMQIDYIKNIILILEFMLNLIIFNEYE